MPPLRPDFSHNTFLPKAKKEATDEELSEFVEKEKTTVESFDNTHLLDEYYCSCKEYEIVSFEAVKNNDMIRLTGHQLSRT